MAIAQGATAPDFTLPDQDGTPVSLSTLLEKGPVVLFFYPMADSSGCTTEVCHFRDLATDFDTVGAQRVGISKDAVDKQARFASKHTLGYPLLSDAGGAVAKSYGVRGLFGLFGPSQRITFVIGQDRIVKKVVTGLMNATAHADEALAALR
jgi:thioredoxin-dependent peroxiredoxin